MTRGPSVLRGLYAGRSLDDPFDGRLSRGLYAGRDSRGASIPYGGRAECDGFPEPYDGFESRPPYAGFASREPYDGRASDFEPYDGRASEREP